MFEGIKRGLRAVQYGDAAIRRRWFFVCAVGTFCLVLAGWVAYEVWRGSLGAGISASVQNGASSWENFTGYLRDAIK